VCKPHHPLLRVISVNEGVNKTHPHAGGAWGKEGVPGWEAVKDTGILMGSCNRRWGMEEK
jgi:hypothetical protein